MKSWLRALTLGWSCLASAVSGADGQSMRPGARSPAEAQTVVVSHLEGLDAHLRALLPGIVIEPWSQRLALRISSSGTVAVEATEDAPHPNDSVQASILRYLEDLKLPAVSNPRPMSLEIEAKVGGRSDAGGLDKTPAPSAPTPPPANRSASLCGGSEADEASAVARASVVDLLRERPVSVAELAESLGYPADMVWSAAYVDALRWLADQLAETSDGC